MIIPTRGERIPVRYSLRLFIFAALALALLLVTHLSLPFASFTSAAQTGGSPALVISQVYGGGGNISAPLTNDFIEIFNRGTTPVALDGLSLQYASASGTGNFGVNSGQLTELSGTLAPGQYLLVQEAGGATGAALPAADIIDPTPINLSGTAGKVALVTGTTSLGCNGNPPPPPRAHPLPRRASSISSAMVMLTTLRGLDQHKGRVTPRQCCASSAASILTTTPRTSSPQLRAHATAAHQPLRAAPLHRQHRLRPPRPHRLRCPLPAQSASTTFKVQATCRR